MRIYYRMISFFTFICFTCVVNASAEFLTASLIVGSALAGLAGAGINAYYANKGMKAQETEFKRTEKLNQQMFEKQNADQWKQFLAEMQLNKTKMAQDTEFGKYDRAQAFVWKFQNGLMSQPDSARTIAEVARRRA